MPRKKVTGKKAASAASKTFEKQINRQGPKDYCWFCTFTKA